MLALKVPLKDAQKWKEYLLLNNIIEKDFRFLKDKRFLYYPIKKKFDIVFTKESEISFVEKKFEKSIKVGSLRVNLAKKLTEKEMNVLQTAHDTIGSIAILEVPKGLVKKEKLIANTLLKINPQIKTVLKKAASHKGIYRTQKMKHLAGIKTKETIYKENNVSIKLDVEKVYFSVRLSNERKRIAAQVKAGEEILVMFSGCAPYPLVLSRNTEARSITAIEANPIGHKYALENLRLNRINNIILVNGDVHKVIPNILEYVVGLKSALIQSQLNAPLRALSNKSKIFEFHLFDTDLFENHKKIERYIKAFQKKGFRIFIHMPFRVYEKGKKDKSGVRYSLGKFNIEKEGRMLDILGELCKKYDVKAIIHTNDFENIDEQLMIENMKKFEKYYDWFYFETLPSGFAHVDDVIRIGKAAGIRNVAIDLAHLHIIHHDNMKMEHVIEAIKQDFNTYFHIADNSELKHQSAKHTCEIGKGLIDFNEIAPLITTGVIEIESKEYQMMKESVHSYKQLNKYSHLKKFDRIIMPLPKTAGKFLDEALMVSKKGTVIHFYDFLEEEKFFLAIEKIDKACRKNKMRYKILELVKCGQHAPHVFRVCVDFEIL